MKLILAVLVSNLLLAATTTAETMYISDMIQINLRTGRGFEYKILAMLDSGQAVEVIETEDDYTRVRIPNGKEGWVLSRYLTAKKPSGLLLESLEKKHREILVRLDETAKENSALKADNKRFTEEISATETVLSDLTRSYETLKSDTADFPKLKSRFAEAAFQLKELRIRADKFEEEVKNLKSYKYMDWFLFGAAFMLLGLVIGFGAKRRRGASSRY